MAMKTVQMRQRLLLACLFAATSLLAQNKSQPYYQTEKAPQQQKALRADCFTRKDDAGTSAARRGDFRAALRLFQEAKNCPEVAANSRRSRDLDKKIEYCQLRLGGTTGVAAERALAGRSVENIELTRRTFVPSAAFARNEDPNCFGITMREADRAFRDSCWEDAAKLYRAAKSCADANQGDRERMSQRIIACEEAAKDELLQKEQKAIRTARHAIAANRADDAMDLLWDGNRALAWRLADFANYYIAPDDNPDCLEAMYSAYFYNKPEQKSQIENPPFCYDLAENFGIGTQYKFYENEFGEFLTAFTPEGARFVTWELPSMKVVEGYSLEILKDPIGFDRTPDGGWLVYGANYFYLPNGEKLDVQQVSNYCFSDDGKYFLYEDISTGNLNLIPLNLAIQAQTQRKNSNNFARLSSPQTLSYPVDNGLRCMKSYKGEFWLGYRDRVVVHSLNKSTGMYAPRMTWFLADTSIAESQDLSMYLFPESRELIVGTPTDAYYLFLNHAPDGSAQETIVPTYKINGQLQACTLHSDKLLAITTSQDSNQDAELMTLHQPAEKRIVSRFLSNTNWSTTWASAISPSGQWVVVKGTDSRCSLWSLRDTSLSPPMEFETGVDNRLSPDGNLIFVLEDDLLKVFDFDDIKNGAEMEIPVLQNSLLPEGLSNKWAVYHSGNIQVSIQHLLNKKVWNFEISPLESGQIPYCFDFQEERFFAYSPSQGMVTVKSLTDQQSLASRDFGGTVVMLRSVPGTDKLLVVTRVEEQPGEIRYTVKVWDFLKPAEKPQTVRLKDYNVLFARISDQGDRLALSNGVDIRLFLLENLFNEAVVIKPPQNTVFYDMAFRPDGLGLVSGDEQGKVSIWDVTNGKPILQFLNVWAGVKHQVYRLAFAYDGTRLRLVSPNRLFTANLDAYALRDVVQSGERRLTSFTPEQIRAYNLEIAFKYPGNFDRLAQSGDIPLILSFFQYFMDQSINSNNIELVNNYCNWATELYLLLDEGGRQNTKTTLLEMLSDFTLKLLLRNNSDGAAQVVDYMNNSFNQPNIALLDGAHTALIQHNLNEASRLYTDYLLRIAENIYFSTDVSGIYTKLSQFKEYDLLDSAQVSCVCGIFNPFEVFDKFCVGKDKLLSSSNSALVKTYKEIYAAMDSVTYWIDRSAKAAVLERAYGLASILPYPNPNVPKHPLDTVVVALASAYLNLGDFELNSPKTPVYYKKAVEILEKAISLNPEPDTAKLTRLSQAYLTWGKYLLAAEKPHEALLKLNNALSAGKKLSAPYEEGTLGKMMVEMRVLSPIYLEICKANLLMGKPNEARKAYQISEEMLQDRLSSTLMGHIYVLENNDIEAFLNFGDLKSVEDLGEALFQIEQMADLLPAQSSQLRAFAPKLKTAFLANHPEISPEAVDYWFASLQMTRHGVLGQWDSALVWSSKTTNSIDLLMQKRNNTVDWRNNWLSQRINQAYYLLFAKYRDTSALSQVVGYSMEALNWIEQYDPYSIYKSYVYTNLAHALWLRNQEGDRKKAIEAYKTHLNAYNFQDDTWELLLKDFRDLHRIGLNWPDFKNLVKQIQPEDVQMTKDDWQEIEL